MSKLDTAEFIDCGVILACDPTTTEPHYILSIIQKQFPCLFLFCPLQLSYVTMQLRTVTSTLTFSDEY